MDDKKTRQSTGSLFLSIPGLVILAFFFVLSLVLKANIVSVFLLLFLIICVIAFMWSHKVSKQLVADVRALTPCCFPKDEIQLEVTLKNQGPLAAIWTDVYLPIAKDGLATPRNGVYSQVQMQHPNYNGMALHQKFTWVAGYQKLTSRLVLTANKRGILTTDYIYLHTGDGFGIGTSRCGNPPNGHVGVTIFPALYPVNTQKLLLKGSAMHAGKRGQYEDVTLVKNIRPYQYGDNFKRINWRMLAKQQDMQVNLYEQITPESILFLLDLESFSYQTHRPGGSDEDMMDCIYEEEMELAISVVASCIHVLAAQGVACGLILPGYKDMPAACIYGEATTNRTEELLYRLAEIDYEGGAVNWYGVDLEAISSGSGKCYVLTHTTPEVHLSMYSFMDTAIVIPYEQYSSIIEVEHIEVTT